MILGTSHFSFGWFDPIYRCNFAFRGSNWNAQRLKSISCKSQWLSLRKVEEIGCHCGQKLHFSLPRTLPFPFFFGIMGCFSSSSMTSLLYLVEMIKAWNPLQVTLNCVLSTWFSKKRMKLRSETLFLWRGTPPLPLLHFLLYLHFCTLQSNHSKLKINLVWV